MPPISSLAPAPFAARASNGGPTLLEILRTLATPEEVDFLVAAAFEGVGIDPAAVPRARESMAFLAGMAARARNAGTPFEATWSLVVDLKGLDSLADPDAVALWGRIRRAMRTLASPSWRPPAGPS